MQSRNGSAEDKLKEWDLLIYDSAKELYTKADPHVFGKPGKGRSFTPDEIYQYMKSEGVWVLEVLDQETAEKYKDFANSKDTRLHELIPVRHLEYTDPATNPVVKRCWSCKYSEVIVYPPGMLDICCRKRSGYYHPMVACIYPNGSVKMTALLWGTGVAETNKQIHMLYGPGTMYAAGLVPDDIPPFEKHCNHRLQKEV